MTSDALEMVRQTKADANNSLYCLTGIAASIFWIGALMLPYDVSYTTRLHRDGGPGWLLFASGWLGPVGYCYAWYANIFFAVAVTQLLRGRVPGLRLSTVGSALALSALLPCANVNWDSLKHWPLFAAPQYGYGSQLSHVFG